MAQLKVDYIFYAPNKFPFEDYSLIKETRDSVSLSKELLALENEMIESGYLSFSIDSLRGDTGLQKVYIHIGKKFNWVKIAPGNVDEGLLSKTGYRAKVYRNQPISNRLLNQLFDDILKELENNGYPFAKIKLDSIQIIENEISAELNIQKNQKIKIDTLEIKGNLKITPNYIANYLDIKKGDEYNEEAFSNISTRVKELPFAFEKLPAEVWFSEDKAKVIVILEKRKANVFNGILGLQPDEETSEVNLTGEIKLKLSNSLGSGEIINLEWKRLPDETQSILAEADLPFIFNTLLGLNGRLEIFRQDTTFNTVKQYLAVPYYLKKGNYFKVFIENQTSTLIGDGEAAISTANSGYNFLGYGLGYKGVFLDYRLNPRKGWELETDVSFGEKKLNEQVLDQFNSEDVSLTSTQIKTNLQASYYIPFVKNSTIKLSVNSGFLQNEQLARNELFRIGGLKSLRGFDEASIFTSGFAIGTLEYRLLLESNSYISAFTDMAYYETNTLSEFISDTPIGFGAGVTFETKAGIFTLNYALGKQFDNPILLRNGKVHFGILNYF